MTKLVDKQDANIERPSRCWDGVFWESGGELEINVQYQKYFER